MKEIPVTNPNDECTSIVGALYAASMTRKQTVKPKAKADVTPVDGWKVGKCPACGNIQVSRSKFSLHCTRCGRMSDWRVSGRWNMVVVLCESEREAVLKCQELKKQKGGVKDG